MNRMKGKLGPIKDINTFQPIHRRLDYHVWLTSRDPENLEDVDIKIKFFDYDPDPQVVEGIYQMELRRFNHFFDGTIDSIIDWNLHEDDRDY